MKHILICIGLFMMALATKAQDPMVSRITEDLLESVGENMGDDTDIQEILDDLETFRQYPLEINRANADDLGRLHLLSETQIDNLLNYRNKTGLIYSLFELMAIEGFSPDIVQKIEPFISFNTNEEQVAKKRPTNDLLARVTRTFPAPEPTGKSRFEGSPERYYLRAKHISNSFDFGYIGEKDPGEAFFGQSNRHGFDHNGAFARVAVGQKNQLYIGDYHVRFGQGLVAWQGFAMGKSSETVQTARSRQGIRSYTSTDENQFLRGLAAKLSKHDFTFYPFISYHKFDASVDTKGDRPTFGAFQSSGYHRTPTEIASEKSVGQWVSGGHASYSRQQWTVSSTAVYTRYSIVMDRSDDPYNQFLPEGKDNIALSIDWKGTWKKIFVFGELAASNNTGKALLAGMMAKPAPNTELSLIYRNINKSYFSNFSNAFTESSRTNDEHGLYLGLKIYPAPHWDISAYSDFFEHRWVKYTTAAPMVGTEFLVQITYSPTRRTNLYLKLFSEEKEQRTISGSTKFNQLQTIRRVRLNFAHSFNEQISIKNRIEYSFYSKQSDEKGWLVYQDFALKIPNKACSLNGRLAYFNTNSYNSRIYAYENDLLYTFSVPAIYGKGLRAYLNIQQKIGDRLTLWIKWAATRKFADTDEGIDTNTLRKQEVKFQVRYQF